MFLLAVVLGSGLAHAQTDVTRTPQPPPLPVPPGVAPGVVYRTNVPPSVRARTNGLNNAQVLYPSLTPPLPFVPPSGPPGPPPPLAPRTFPTPALTAPSLLPPNSLAWDAESKDIQAKLGDTNAVFSFWLTNVCDKEVLVNSVRTSCGCTVAKLPETPWHIKPGASGPIGVTVDLRGKRGKVVKTVTVDTTAGVKSLLVNVTLPVDPQFEAQMNRSQNMQLAMADRQMVFRGDCAKCHVEPAKGKMGRDLYVASCGVCHEAEHRASMVPDLKALKHPTDLPFWTQWIRVGKPGSLMPAFAADQGGPLTDEQVKSLAAYLDKTYKGTATAAVAPQVTVPVPENLTPAPAATPKP
jgi:mono/diheme cytochrome c family protein